MQEKVNLGKPEKQVGWWGAGVCWGDGQNGDRKGGV